MNTLNYKTSHDYKRLVELMKRQSVICIVDDPKDGGREAANTRYGKLKSGIEDFWILNSGRWHTHGCGELHFITQCKAANVEFIEPLPDPKEWLKADFENWNGPMSTWDQSTRDKFHEELGLLHRFATNETPAGEQQQQ